MTREEWLQRATKRLRPLFKAAGSPLPDVVHVSVGLPSRRALSSKKRVIGECWTGTASADGNRHVFVSPLLGDAVQALETLVHELAHAALPHEVGHKAPFVRLARAVGLEGKATATVAGEQLRGQLQEILAKIGPYPHAALNAAQAGKKQSTRLLKAECPECGYTVRVTRKWADVGLPICPTCEQSLELV